MSKIRALILRHSDYGPEGVVGYLLLPSGNVWLDTLEHAYRDEREPSGWTTKIPKGTYTCKKGEHTLSHGQKIVTFEILNVPPFQGTPVTGCLFHVGDFNRDSEGCILLGTGCSWGSNARAPEVPIPTLRHSRIAFSKFMALFENQDTFTLEVQ